MSDIEKVDLESKDLVAERVERLKALFPEIAVEGDGSIDFEKLRLILGDEVDEGQERYAFTWPGKADAIRQSQMPFVRRKCLQLLPFVPMRMQASIGTPLRTFISRAITLKC